MVQDNIYYQLQKDCYIRQIDEYGYIKSAGLFNDLFLDNNGAKFLSALSRSPQSLEELSKKIAERYDNCNPKDIQPDVQEFFDMLTEDGFVVKGSSVEEVTANNIGFNYDNIDKVDFKEDFSPEHVRSENDSQLILGKYFIEHPHISNFQIELTSKCNERCVHCYIPHENKISDIKSDLYYKVINELKELGGLGLTLSGGEPMVHPQFKEFLRAAKDRDFFVHVLSNLTLLDEDIIKEMRKGNTCAVQTSLYSLVPEHHDAITTVKGSFEKTKNNILRLIANNIPVQISCPVMKANKDDVADIFRWGHEHKLRVNIDYAIMAEYDHQTQNLANRLSPEECRDVIKAIMEEDKDYQNQILSNDFVERCSNINNDPDAPFCGVGINTCCMVANGDVYPCPGWQGYVCGNLNEMSLKEIWTSSDAMIRLRNIRKRDLPQCLSCENKAFCSPCLGRFANESPDGNYLEVAEHFCKVAKVNREVVLDFRKEQGL